MFNVDKFRLLLLSLRIFSVISATTAATRIARFTATRLLAGISSGDTKGVDNIDSGAGSVVQIADSEQVEIVVGTESTGKGYGNGGISGN